MLIPLREIVLRIPLKNPANLADRLAEAANRQRYSVERKSREIFLCKPRFGLPRLLKCNQVSVQIEENNLLLTGPAGIVNKIRKKL